MNDDQNRDPLAMIAVLIILFVLLSGGVGGGDAAPFKTDVPRVLVMFDATPSEVAKLQTEHPGQSDVITSQLDDGIRARVVKAGGQWINYGSKEPEPAPTEWAHEPWLIWRDKHQGKTPLVIAAGPTKRGYVGPIPENQEAALKALAPIGVK